MSHFNEVLIVAGTHGNELSGIYIEQLIRSKALTIDYASFQVETLLANPEAIRKNVRFIDTDLNRLFTVEAPHMQGRESVLANRLQQLYSHKKNQLVIDLHNTNSHMGATLILLANSPFYERMGSFVKTYMPGANIIFETQKDWQSHPYLCSMTGAGVIIEVEEESHGVLTHRSLTLMKKLLLATLNFIETENQGLNVSLIDYDAYRLSEEIAFPLNEQGMRLGTVHPTLCGADFREVKPGEPLLSLFSGKTYDWSGTKSTYPHFINEAAYANQHIAMALSEKIHITVANK